MVRNQLSGSPRARGSVSSIRRYLPPWSIGVPSTLRSVCSRSSFTSLRRRLVCPKTSRADQRLGPRDSCGERRLGGRLGECVDQVRTVIVARLEIGVGLDQYCDAERIE